MAVDSKKRQSKMRVSSAVKRPLQPPRRVARRQQRLKASAACGREGGLQAPWPSFFGSSDKFHSPPDERRGRRRRRRRRNRKRETIGLFSLEPLTALVDAVLVARHLPELGSDLVAALAGLQGHDLAQGGRRGEEGEEKKGGVASSAGGKRSSGKSNSSFFSSLSLSQNSLSRQREQWL